MGNINCDKLGDKIYELRKQKNLTQDEFAKEVGVTRQTVSKWEANIIQPKADKIERIGKVLEVDLKYLMLQDSGLNVIDKNSIESIVVASDIVETDQEKLIIGHADNKKLSNKTKKSIIIAIVVFSITLIIGITMIIFSGVNKIPEKEGSFDDGFTSTTWNFDLESLGWIFFTISIIILVLLGTALIWQSVKNKKEGDIYGKK